MKPNRVSYRTIVTWFVALSVVHVPWEAEAADVGASKRMLLDGEISLNAIAAEVKALQNSNKLQTSSIVSLQSTVSTQQNTITTLQNLLNAQQTLVNNLKNSVNTQQSTINALQQTSGHGSTYVRWGSTACPANVSDLVYSGYTGGSDYTEPGGPANTLCLTPDPQWGYYEDARNSGAHVSGSEFETCDEHTACGKNFFGTDTNDEDMPCAVCQSPRSKMLMLPGRRDCYGGWTKEYEGYLMAGWYGTTASGGSSYICVDKHPNIIPGGHANKNGHIFYFVEGRCGSLTCPPYVDGRELTCVVCTK